MLSEAVMRSSEETASRVDLPGCYRLLARFGMTDLIFSIVSLPECPAAMATC